MRMAGKGYVFFYLCHNFFYGHCPEGLITHTKNLGQLIYGLYICCWGRSEDIFWYQQAAIAMRYGFVAVNMLLLIIPSNSVTVIFDSHSQRLLRLVLLLPPLTLVSTNAPTPINRRQSASTPNNNWPRAWPSFDILTHATNYHRRI